MLGNEGVALQQLGTHQHANGNLLLVLWHVEIVAMPGYSGPSQQGERTARSRTQ
jgi:hypothetical protein